MGEKIDINNSISNFSLNIRLRKERSSQRCFSVDNSEMRVELSK